MAPGYWTAGKYFADIIHELEAKHEEFGYLGATATVGLSSSSRNTNANLMYFRTKKQLMEYAHSPLHMQAWRYYDSIAKSHPHIAIYHETYQVDPGNYASV